MSLPDAENRRKILQVILGKEELSDSFDFNELSQLTDGYSGSDLKVGWDSALSWLSVSTC